MNETGEGGCLTDPSSSSVIGLCHAPPISNPLVWGYRVHEELCIMGTVECLGGVFLIEGLRQHPRVDTI